MKWAEDLHAEMEGESGCLKKRKKAALLRWERGKTV